MSVILFQIPVSGHFFEHLRSVSRLPLHPKKISAHLSCEAALMIRDTTRVFIGCAAHGHKRQYACASASCDCLKLW